MTQYTGSYSSISTTYLNFFYSKLGPLDEYIIMRIGDSQYGMLVHRIPSGDILQYTITPNGSYGSSGYNVTETTNAIWDYTVYNELYVYSNVGYGTMQVLPVHEIMVCWGITGFVCLVFRHF